DNPDRGTVRGPGHASAERAADAVPSGLQRAALRPGQPRPLLPVHRGDRPEVRLAAHARFPAQPERDRGNGGAGMKPATLALALLLLAGGGQQMAHQPAYRPLERSPFFADERSARPLVEGTVARGELRLGPFFTGRKPANEVGALKAATLLGN